MELRKWEFLMAVLYCFNMVGVFLILYKKKTNAIAMFT